MLKLLKYPMHFLCESGKWHLNFTPIKIICSTIINNSELKPLHESALSIQQLVERD